MYQKRPICTLMFFKLNKMFGEDKASTPLDLKHTF